MKRIKATHPGGTSETLLNDVLRNPAVATERISQLETTVGRFEEKIHCYRRTLKVGEEDSKVGQEDSKWEEEDSK